MNIAIVGATGLVGKTVLSILKQRNFPINSLFLLASEKREEILSLADFDWEKNAVDIAFFCVGNDLSLHYAPIARDSGCVVIDNSSAFRYHDNVPLIVPEVNGDILPSGFLLTSRRSSRRLPSIIIANPNCSTIQMLLVLAPIHKIVGIKRVIVSTYQAVSGAGQALMETLENGEKTASSIHANVIPQIDVLQENGYSREEMKMLWESRKILNAPNLLLSATAVRVPVMNAHSEAVTVETESPFNVAEAIQCLKNKPGLIVSEDRWITPKEVSGYDEVFVSRIRQDLAFGEYGLSFWIVADNLRKGAALNAVQIAEIFSGK
ncbi:MAG: aspartate-semialdehyde dehydrogenase [Pseudomonadota bacterium]